jgi:hypothetical protein
MPLYEQAMGAPLSAFIISLTFLSQRWFAFQFVPNFNRISLGRNIIAVSTDQLYIRAAPCFFGFASGTLRDLLVSF